ncbi:peptidylprolyl isomerase [Nocardia cyriacigeorgica]|uniref:Peptidyl-prolyl cis-trans isomerase n=2 Tax=Nocardia cyriacigeorgica TaxID=135487 RepID=H6R231_NOCCG|nr:peptidylprolyl isomerase [Nocardia cyriacigeorgica]MBF6080742.1 peptidylprolyl isomerase [Nocardia cyriacigeorgica]MBF6284622.1 peptidylprolyl isomerase [Nocardia cyriacigeorgica]MBF6423575.1 peptidylprolyl isomerase [Nocardia cyriacigeorgica]NEW33933.1 peptidylprolyl isomerase [Nocardia cyriacigeorgica]CCF64319.1 putative peptidyl-prolyl cis-trans isomerase [Nocardia cyriacigeorgica GUH-2]
MPSNEQRRAAAKRKLERQLANRAARARKRKQLTIAMSALGVVVAVAAVTGVYFLTRGDDSDNTAAETPDASLSSTPIAAPPPPAQAKPATVSCAYPDSPKPADKPAQKPRTEGIQTSGDNATLSISVETSQGPIGLTLNNAESPCTVNSFASLAGQGFFDGTSCHRLTQGPGLEVLQCGDPTGTGMGGPGYQFDNEYPTDQYAPGDPALQEPIAYKRGVIAMANAGPGTNGSQFFLVYGDSQLPPNYTIFGTVDETGLATLDKIAQAGQDESNGPGDGKPNLPVTLNSVRID